MSNCSTKAIFASRDDYHRLGSYANGVQRRYCSFRNKFQSVERDEHPVRSFGYDPLLLRVLVQPLVVGLLEVVEVWVEWVGEQVALLVHALVQGKVRLFSPQQPL